MACVTSHAKTCMPRKWHSVPTLAGSMTASTEQAELPRIVLHGPEKSSATVYCHGAHVTSWTDSSGAELIFVSKDAIFRPPKAIRGGVPVCFPQFGVLGPLGQHGFARNSAFTIVSTTADTAVLQLEPSEEHLKAFHHAFRLIVTVRVDRDGLHQKLEVLNIGSSAFEFTAALHTYLSVSSIAQVGVHGLKGLEYFDNTDGRDGKCEEAEVVTVSGETDRIYKHAPDLIKISDRGAGRALTLHKSGFPDAVLWNPWKDKAKGMSDFGDDEFKAMICLEPALAKSGPVKLEPHERWSAFQELTASKL